MSKQNLYVCTLLLLSTLCGTLASGVVCGYFEQPEQQPADLLAAQPEEDAR